MRNGPAQSMLSGYGTEDEEFFTVGYERTGSEDLYLLLKSFGVNCLVDVREVPWSRVPDYRKSALERRLEEYGEKYGHRIRYVSMPGLGNPEENRKSDKKEEEHADHYRRYALGKTLELERLRQLIKTSRTALMCYEKDPQKCHRSILARIMEEKYGLTHIDISGCVH
ncbi:hypothetical protein CUJ83_05005 [Methanocella sp. CWC-04]|uniref:DUF488 domain-containing protein n=1 Tax=Methanooceanicella nereidis TaxID=2052831 RepID=A0AAP2W6Q3_9EURY|nr:DUF488 domain-containing protein [Methanocella sp. CWC-04]MCD1294356.1 hypothetical protein [Methanocella sp. CWC-04]